MLYESGHGYAEIGRTINVSRQRIHQLLKEYKNTARQGRVLKYRQLLKKCKVCRNKATNLHHIDFNNKNDDLTNLLSICKECHYKIHKDRTINRFRGKWCYKYDFCLRCHRTCRKHWAKGYCDSCYHFIRKLRLN